MEHQTTTSARALGAALKPRQLTMMGLGGAIGTGLFIGSGAGVQAAGPAVLSSYLVAGTLIILVMWALGEMAAANPDSGAFSVYTAKAYRPVAGATVGWLWWIQLVVVIAAEALGAVAAVTGRTKVILLCPPNNPADISITHDRLEAFLRSVRSDVLVVIDEAYVRS